MPSQIQDESTYIKQLIYRIAKRYPKRQATSQQEQMAQIEVCQELESLGLQAHWETFTFNKNLFANLALHFGLSVIATLISLYYPLLGCLLHLLVGWSYLSDSLRLGYILRRLFLFRPSQNLVAVMPAKTREPRLRVVMLAHADAAYTGWIFSPFMVRQTVKKSPPGLGFLKRSMAFATFTVFVVGILEGIRYWAGFGWQPLEWLLTIPSVVVLLLNMQMVIRNETVPGANDNLTGVASLPVLASRFSQKKPDDIELVFVVTGAEEASLGGSHALYLANRDRWDRKKTVILSLDTLSGGDLQYFEEGEVMKLSLKPELRKAVEDVAASQKRFQEVKAFRIPAGGTDAVPFIVKGYQSIGLGCTDHTKGAPANYHLPSDIPENVDYDKVLFSIDFTEALLDKLCKPAFSTQLQRK